MGTTAADRVRVLFERRKRVYATKMALAWSHIADASLFDDENNATQKYSFQ